MFLSCLRLAGQEFRDQIGQGGAAVGGEVISGESEDFQLGAALLPDGPDEGIAVLGWGCVPVPGATDAQQGLVCQPGMPWSSSTVG